MAEMTRSEFLKNCALGACSCSMVALSVTGAAAAESGTSEVDALKAQREAIRIRYAKLLGMDEEVDEPTRKRIFQRLGRVCAEQFRAMTYDKYKNDIRGFLAAIQTPSGWVEKAEYNEKTGTIRIIDRSRICTCPLVEKGLTPSDQCECTLGWQKETYSATLGKPVEAELEESLLRGGSRCVFRIQVV